MYLHAVTVLNINSITHKFLIRGHTQNEGDTAHSLIEKNIKLAKKSGPIYAPDQYVSLIRTAKKRGEPFEVCELNFSDFYDLKALSEDIGLNITKNESGEQVKVSQIRMVRFDKGFETYRYKISYSGEWQSIKIKNRRSVSKKTDPKMNQAYKSKFTIPGRKKEDLKKLINANIIPKFYEHFYNSLF